MEFVISTSLGKKGNTMSKYTHLFGPDFYDDNTRVHNRKHGEIPYCTPAVDVFVRDADGYLTIKNPSPRYKGNTYIN